MIQIIVYKNELFGWSVGYVYKDEESTRFDFDIEEQALEKALELAKISFSK